MPEAAKPALSAMKTINTSKQSTTALHSASTSVEAKASRRRPPKSKITDRTKVRVVPVRADREGSSGSDPGSDQGSDLGEMPRRRITVSKVGGAGLADAPPSTLFSSDSESSSESAPLSSDDSLLSSITKFRDDFDAFKCKMRIFGESLALCKCIAHDFKGRLVFMERRLNGLERRQKHNKTHNNYTEIIQKNKQLSTKTKEYVAKLQKNCTEAEMREVAGRICRNYLPGLWKVAEPQDLKFRKITGGLSNFLYLVGLPDDLRALYQRLDKTDDEEVKAIRDTLDSVDVPKQVLLRIYGQVHGERAMDAIVTESVIFTLLSERRLGPRLYGVFSGGRIEEFIQARCLLTRELADPAISMKIAEKTAAIHSMEIPLSKEGTYMWKTMGRWLKTIKEDIFSNGIKGKDKSEQNAIARMREVDFAAETDWLRKYLATFESAIVFCHNDLQEGNVLLLEGNMPMSSDVEAEEYNTSNYSPPKRFDLKNISLTDQLPKQEMAEEYDPREHRASHAAFLGPLLRAGGGATAGGVAGTGSAGNIDEQDSDSVHSHTSDSGEPKLYLIDFEYCAYNYRAFDIANHFAEWGYDYTNPEHPYYFEYPDYWPTLEQKEIFIKEYLKQFSVLTSEGGVAGAEADPPLDAVNRLLAEVDAFALGSHLFWTLWSIVNASKSQIPFGYWDYGLSRLETYQRLKQEVIKKEKFGLPVKRKIEEVDI